MRYRVTETPRFTRSLRRLDPSVSRRILVELYRLVELEDPTVRLKPLRRELAGLWRLRVGDHRVVVDVVQRELVIVALDAGHRRDVHD